jgi:hypothetical protein
MSNDVGLEPVRMVAHPDRINRFISYIAGQFIKAMAQFQPAPTTRPSQLRNNNKEWHLPGIKKPPLPIRDGLTFLQHE